MPPVEFTQSGQTDLKSKSPIVKRFVIFGWAKNENSARFIIIILSCLFFALTCVIVYNHYLKKPPVIAVKKIPVKILNMLDERTLKDIGLKRIYVPTKK